MRYTTKKLSGTVVRAVEYAGGTWLEPEEAAYVGGMKRRGAAMFPDGKIRRVYVGLPDSFFSAPAHARVKGNYVRGFVMLDDDDDGVLRFHSDAAEKKSQKKY